MPFPIFGHFQAIPGPHGRSELHRHLQRRHQALDGRPGQHGQVLGPARGQAAAAARLHLAGGDLRTWDLWLDILWNLTKKGTFTYLLELLWNPPFDFAFFPCNSNYVNFLDNCPWAVRGTASPGAIAPCLVFIADLFSGLLPYGRVARGGDGEQ